MFKKLFVIVCVILIGFGLCACSSEKEDVVRIHIRANSNADCDQSVKLHVRDAVIEFITPVIANCENSAEVKRALYGNLHNLEGIANKVLYDNGFSYVSRADIRNEYFPSRSYDGVVFPADYYDALIIELGSGVGDNWWCVAYPPLCFVGEDVDGSSIRYRSKILELINSFWGG